MISFIDVNKFILSNATLHIPKGVAVGIIGKTGSGKTTFLKLACGLLEPDKGQVYTFGVNPVERKRRFVRSIAALFAHLPLLNPEESIHDNLENRGIAFGEVKSQYTVECERLMLLLGLIDFSQEKVKNLSLGQRKRAELVSVFATKPQLLLLDEPTIGLDQNGKTAFRNLVLERTREGLTTVITSHDMSDITSVCNRVAILSKGNFCAYGNQKQLLKKYAPTDEMEIVLESNIPNLMDLPIARYSVDGDSLTLSYNSNHISASEILRAILKDCKVKGIAIRKPRLEDVILAIEKGR